jgi:hypothetical protein
MASLTIRSYENVQMRQFSRCHQQEAKGPEVEALSQAVSAVRRVGRPEADCCGTGCTVVSAVRREPLVVQPQGKAVRSGEIRETKEK